MNDFNILITEARVTGVSLRFDSEKKLQWAVTASLCTDDGREITDMSFSSDAWTDKNKIELPASLEPFIKRIFGMATPLVSKKIMNQFIALPEPEVKYHDGV